MRTEDAPDPGWAREHPRIPRLAGGAWCLKKSRNKFAAQHAAALARTAAEGKIRQILGNPTPSGEGANFSELDAWLSGWKITNRKATTSSDAVYAGYLDVDGSPRSKAGPSWAWISLTRQYLDRCTTLARVFPAFSTMCSELELPRYAAPSDVQMVLSGFRAELFRQVGHADVGDHVSYEDNSDLVDAMEDPLFTLRTAKSCIRWAIAHELAHLMHDRAHLRARGRQAVRDAGLTPSEFSTKQTIEVGCDAVALDYLLGALDGGDDVITVLTGSLVGTLANVWDGWFEDESAPSGTHPSPTLRFLILRHAWLGRLTELSEGGWDPRSRPLALDSRNVALLFAFEEWGAGDYEPHRSGPVILERVAQYEQLTAGAIGDPGYISPILDL